ncbi:PREDICTED: uncharacterized protein LOC105567787 [Vollenhovia emeryi]|uniref:uncharacterized protein LOC105567787 n=1 Tax=Vollenhovia emeryi TaxID=411798 RepID=UPI0005F40E79|nr:PREDICTED: uncharacterized protein LOC105567787 [Vollenhovia emeryi]
MYERLCALNLMDRVVVAVNFHPLTRHAPLLLPSLIPQYRLTISNCYMKNVLQYLRLKGHPVVLRTRNRCSVNRLSDMKERGKAAAECQGRQSATELLSGFVVHATIDSTKSTLPGKT